jgi:hypothetical protein
LEDEMRSTKRFSNVGFTKRVDHEGGRHHASRAPAEPVVCPDCGATYANRRWSRLGAATQTVAAGSATTRRCPACRKKAVHVPPNGYLHLGGSYFAAHRDEIRHLVENEASRAADDNPVGRIMDWTEEGADKVLVTTTTEHLAQRLGHAVEKAFGGKTRYDFSHENKLARVHWSRD